MCILRNIHKGKKNVIALRRKGAASTSFQFYHRLNVSIRFPGYFMEFLKYLSTVRTLFFLPTLNCIHSHTRIVWIASSNRKTMYSPPTTTIHWKLSRQKLIFSNRRVSVFDRVAVLLRFVYASGFGYANFFHIYYNLIWRTIHIAEDNTTGLTFFPCCNRK